VVQDVDERTRDGRGRRTPRLVRFLGIAAVLPLFALTAATLLSRWVFLGDLVASFRWQVGWVGVVIAALLLLARMRILSLLAALAAVWLLAPGLRLELAGDPEPTGGPTFTIASANLLFTSGQEQAQLEWIVSQERDLIALHEVPRAWPAAAEELIALYPQRLTFPEGDKAWHGIGFGIGLYTRLPVESKRVVHVLADCLPLLEMVVRVGERRVTVRTIHPPAPQTGALWSLRNQFLAAVANAFVWDADTVLMGDFNASSGSPAFGDLLERTGLRDSRAGFGRLPTWRSESPVRGLWVDLDHILLHGSLQSLERGTSTIPASDHHAATAVLELGPR
jgi:endonuclease/exonuclease/phosphatase (EEP) superfamily protein YafD